MSSRQGRTLVIGESLIDVVHRADGAVERHPGGSPLNVAIGLARLGHQVEYATRFAEDPDGEMVRGHLARERMLALAEGSSQASKTSTATATLDASGAASYTFDLAWDLALPRTDGVGHLHTGSIAATLHPGAATVLRAVRAVHASATVSYDPNIRPALMGSPGEVLEQIESLIAMSDVVKASDEDAAWLYPRLQLDEVLQRWSTMGPSLVVATRGKRGSRALVAATGEKVDLPANATVVVDTVGAGDSYMSGLVSGLLDAGMLGGPEQRDTLRRAHLAGVLPALMRAGRCGDITVSRAGANPPLRSEL